MGGSTKQSNPAPPPGFAHAGKDGHPYPVDRETYDRSIEVLRTAVQRARLGQREKVEALRRLSTLRAG